MSRTHRAIFLALIIPFSFLQASTVTDTIEIDSLFRTIETHYGPLEYKARQVGLDWDRTKTQYRDRFLKTNSTNEFYGVAAELFGELKDAHVRVILPSSYEAHLPLQFSYVENKTVVNYMDGELVQSGRCPVDIGQELVRMDGVTVDALRSELARIRGMGNTRSDQSYLTRTLTVRQQTAGLPVPLGASPTAVLEFQRNGAITRCEIPWKTKGYPLVDLQPDAGPPAQQWTKRAGLDSVKTFLRRLVALQDKLVSLRAPLPLLSPLDGLLGTQKEDKHAKGKKVTIGHKKPLYPMPRTFRPFDAPALMDTLIQTSGLYAGTFLHQGKTVGYLRIPDYVAGHPILAQFALRYVIYKLEDEAQYLVVDQTNNPGGYVQFSDAIVEAFTGKIDKDRHMRFAVRPTQSFIRTYAEILSLLEQSGGEALGIPQSFKDKYIPRLKAEMAKVVDAYRKGKKLSEPIDFHLMSELVTELVDGMLVRLLSEEYPAFKGVLNYAARRILGISPGKKYFFTKPIYFLINELDFSGGDATPAVLKDYNRVTLVGVNTAGAGGSVGKFTHSVQNAFSFTLTQSLMVRPGGVMVENVGVAPDIAFDVELKDIRDGYQTYFTRLMKTIKP